MAPWAVGAGAGVLALGPGLGPGFVLRYDMVFVPDPPLSATTLGGGGGFPRAVPSDAVVGALAQLLPADAVQTVLLLAVFVLGAAGAARLVPGPYLVPRLAAAVFYVWNPFIAERLLLGQWAVLLGYAGLPWVLSAAVRLARARDLARLVVALLPAAVGGFSSVVLSALVALPAGLWGRRGAADQDRRMPIGQRVPGAVRSAVLAVAALAVVSLPWLVPALGSGARTDPAAVDLFAARADTPFGTVGSLVVLGGIWNAQAVPEWYGHPFFAACRLVLSVAALAGWVWLLRRCRPLFGRGLTAAAAAGFAIALLGVAEPGRELLRALIGAWPGFGPLRDGQLYVAPLALLQAVGFGGAAMWLRGAAGSGTGHGGDGDPGEPLSSSEADREAGSLRVFGALWTSAAGSAGGGRPGAGRGAGAARVAGAVAAAMLLVAPFVLLPGLVWGAAGRLAPIAYPGEWTAVQRIVSADERPGAVLVLPWSAYRGLDWSGDGSTAVVLDPATKLFDRRVVWNDDLRVEEGGAVRVIEGEDQLARRVDRLHAAGVGVSGYLESLGTLGIRYVLIEREALRGPDTAAAVDPLSAGLLRENKFSDGFREAEVVHRGPRLILLELHDEQVGAVKDELSVLEVTGWLATVGAIIWSLSVSGSSLVSMRPDRNTGTVSRKESPTC
mgnify:FL=1